MLTLLKPDMIQKASCFPKYQLNMQILIFANATADRPSLPLLTDNKGKIEQWKYFSFKINIQ